MFLFTNNAQKRISIHVPLTKRKTANKINRFNVFNINIIIIRKQNLIETSTNIHLHLYVFFILQKKNSELFLLVTQYLK